MLKYLPQVENKNLPAVIKRGESSSDYSERDLLYKVLFDLKKDLNQVKSLVLDIYKNDPLAGQQGISPDNIEFIKQLQNEGSSQWIDPEASNPTVHSSEGSNISISKPTEYSEPIIVEESLSLANQERDLILKALKKHRNKRKLAANDLGISERTLYRKIKEYDI